METATVGTEARGPVDFVLIEFQGNRLTGRAAEALLDLVDRGIVSVYDVMVIGKDASGAAYRAEMSRANTAELGSSPSSHGLTPGCSPTTTWLRRPRPWSPAPSPS